VLSDEWLTKVSDHKSLLWNLFEGFEVGMIRRSDEFFDHTGRLQKYFSLIISTRIFAWEYFLDGLEQIHTVRTDNCQGLTWCLKWWLGEHRCGTTPRLPFHHSVSIALRSEFFIPFYVFSLSFSLVS
jgi:hypothetical protein